MKKKNCHNSFYQDWNNDTAGSLLSVKLHLCADSARLGHQRDFHDGALLCQTPTIRRHSTPPHKHQRDGLPRQFLLVPFGAIHPSTPFDASHHSFVFHLHAPNSFPLHVHRWRMELAGNSCAPTFTPIVTVHPTACCVRTRSVEFSDESSDESSDSPATFQLNQHLQVQIQNQIVPFVVHVIRRQLTPPLPSTARRPVPFWTGGLLSRERLILLIWSRAKSPTIGCM